jgi:hypothetical protein
MPCRFTGSVGALAIVLVAVVPILGGCAGTKPAPAGTQGPVSASSPAGTQGPVSASSPAGTHAPIYASPPAITGYWQTLTSVNEKLASDLRRLRSARTPSEVSSAATTAEADAYRNFYRLVGVSPPAGLRASQDALTLALRGFLVDLDNTGSAANAGDVCAGSSAMAMISRSTGTAQLRSAEARLATANPPAGSGIGSLLAPLTADTNRQLANGTLVKRATLTGLGELTIYNGNDTDAVVSLVLAGSHVASMAIYVRANSSATTSAIGNGTYQVYFTTGTAWDSPDHLFARNCDFERLDRNFRFTTTTQGGATDYTKEQITFPGSVTESHVPPEQFPVS